jgi:hypothetical protein
MTVNLPLHLTCAGFAPDQKRGLADSAHRFACADDQVSTMRPPRYVSWPGLTEKRALGRRRTDAEVT